MVLNRRPERQRSGRGSAADAVQEDVLREETRQLNVALPVELHQRLKVAAVQEGISVREWTAPWQHRSGRKTRSSGHTSRSVLASI